MAGLRPRGTPNPSDGLELDGPSSGPSASGGARDLEIDIPGKPAQGAPVLPSLDLDLPAQQAPVPQAAPSQPSGRNLLDEMDDDAHLEGSGISLDLDTSGGAPLPPGVSQPSIPAAPVSQRSMGASVPPVSQRSLPPTAVSQRPMAPHSGAQHSGSLPPASGPTSVRPQQGPAPLEVDAFDARALADYEPPPDAFWMTPMYAYRVLTRRAEVVREVAQAKVDAETARARAEDALVALGERLRPVMEAQGGVGLDAVLAAEATLRARDGALAGELDAQRARQAQESAQLATLEGELAGARARSDAARREVEAARTVRDRVDAAHRRADIEARNASSVRAQTPGAEFDVAAVQSSLAEHAAVRDARAAELGRATSALAAADQRLAAAEQQLGQVQAKVDALRAASRAADERTQRQLSARGAGADDARTRYRAALVDVARAALGTAAVPPELASLQVEATRAEQDAHAKAERARLWEVGVDQFERGKVAMGLGLAGGAVLILLLLLLFPFIYRAIVVD